MERRWFYFVVEVTLVLYVDQFPVCLWLLRNIHTPIPYNTASTQNPQVCATNFVLTLDPQAGSIMSLNVFHKRQSPCDQWDICPPDSNLRDLALFRWPLIHLRLTEPIHSSFILSCMVQNGSNGIKSLRKIELKTFNKYSPIRSSTALLTVTYLHSLFKVRFRYS